MNYIGAFKQDSRQKWCHLKLEEKRDEFYE